MDIQWFPGHMARTMRTLQESLPQADLVIETCDARIPFSSRNPALGDLLGTRPRMLLLNKADLADPVLTRRWLDRQRTEGMPALAVDALSRKDLPRIRAECFRLGAEVLEKARAKGRKPRPVRVLVVGIPNTGKSTLINALSGRKAFQVEDRPGVTRGLQWIRTPDGLEFGDAPGVLWPNLGDRGVQVRLAATGAIKDAVLDQETLVMEVLDLLRVRYPEALCRRFRLEREEVGDLAPPDLLEQAAIRRGCLLPGARPDRQRFSVLFLDDLRGGRIGRITLETPEDAHVSPD